MFTRRMHNRSGTISVVVVDKSGGRFTEIHRVRVAHNEEEAASLEAEGRHWIATYGGQQLIDFEGRADKELRTAEDVLSCITSTRLSAAQTIIGKVYDSIGFNDIEDEELRHLVIGRICQPMSKRDTVDYLRRHFKDDVSLQKIYRYIDKLNNTQKVVFRASPKEATYIPTKPLHRSQMVIEEDMVGYTTFQLEVIVNPELERDLLAYGCGITVLSPQSLVKSIRRHHKAALNP